MLKWCIELREYDITYEPRKVNIAQVLADFIIELPKNTKTIKVLKDEEQEWALFIDGASGSGHQGARIIL